MATKKPRKSKRPAMRNRIARAVKSHRGRNSMGVSPLIPKNTGPGTGCAIAERFKRKTRAKEKKQKQGPKIRLVTVNHPVWRYEVHFKHDITPKSERLAVIASVSAFIRTSLTGKWKIIRLGSPVYSTTFKQQPVRIMTKLLLTDDADLLKIMLCHREAVWKIFQFETNESP